MVIPPAGVQSTVSPATKLVPLMVNVWAAVLPKIRVAGLTPVIAGPEATVKLKAGDTTP